MNKWGRASHFDFDDETKWVTVPDVPLLDEHEMSDEHGRSIAYVGKKELEQIAFNNNKRVVETGDPATIILGHTSDDPQAPEKPAKGFVVNYKVKPFKRDPQTGQIIYAVHGDYKIRPKNANIIEDFPRRSVELWWNKKEIDPIAVLGGTTPERDLSVIIRKARFFHIAVLGGTAPERDLSTTVRFARRGNDTIEHYLIDAAPLKYAKDGGKVEKVMSEFKHGTLHSGSKKGPKVTDPQQAKAIALSEARKAGEKVKKKSDTSETPHKYEEGDPMDDSMDYEAGMHNPSDGGGEYGPDGMEVNTPMGGDNPEDDAERDPMLAKIFQSQQWKGMQQQIEQLTGQLGDLVAVLQGGGEGEPGMEGEGEPPPEGMEGEEPPPEGGESGESGEGEEGEEGEERNPEDEERRMHGQQPVQFESTGFAGPTNTNIPRMGTSGNRYARSKNGDSMPKNNNNEVVKLRRTVEGLTAKLARADAEKIVNQLEGEGILFGDNEQEHMQGKQEETDFLALLDDESRVAQVDIIRKRYKRRPANPATPGIPGVARFARSQISNGAGMEGNADNPEEFEPQTPQEACDLADLTAGPRKLSRADAVKAIKKRRSQGAYPASPANANFGM